MSKTEKILHPDKKVRRSVVEAIGHAVVERSSPDPEFVAMWTVAIHERKEIGRKGMSHLRNMMAVQLSLITNQTDRSTYNPEHWKAVEDLIAPELNYFDSLELDKLPERYRAALQDVLKLQKKAGRDKA